MPIWENYQVEVEVKATVRVNGKTITTFMAAGAATGGSNPDVDKRTMTMAVEAAVKQAMHPLAGMSLAFQNARKEQLRNPQIGVQL